MPAPDDQQEFDCFDDWVGSAMQPFLIEKRGRGQSGASLYSLRQNEVFSDPAVPDLVIQMIVKGSIRCSIDLGFGRFDRTLRPGAFLVSVPDQVFDVEGETTPFELLLISFPWQQLRPNLEETFGFELPNLGAGLHSDVHHDPKVAQFTQLLWQEANSPCPSSELCTQGLETAIIGRLLFLSNLCTADRRGDGKLSAWQLRRVVDLMQARIETGVELEELSQVAGLSRFHFARTFKRSTGVSPNQYLIRLRVIRVEQMLRDPLSCGQPLAHIAAVCGFSDQPHMTRHFRRQTGMTPRQFQLAR